MTSEERDLISKFVARVGGGQTGAFAPGSVPQTLPAIDRDADAYIAQQFQQYPDARYRITQTAVVQEAALAEAQNRIQRLQWELEQTRHAATQAAPEHPKGFFSSLFGGGAAQQQRPMTQPGMQPGMQQGMQPGYGQAFQPTSAPPQPQYPPSYQPGMFQRGGGSGFLGSALTTAAGVAGGMVVGNALMGALGGHGGSASTSPWGGSTGTDSAGGDVFGGAGAAPVDTGAGFGTPASFSDPFGGGGVDAGATSTGSWDSGGGAFDGGGGGFDTGGGGGGFDDNT